MSVESNDPVKTLTLSETAEVLRVSKSTVLSMIKRGLPARKIGRAWRIPVSALNDWLERGQERGQEPEPKQA